MDRYRRQRTARPGGGAVDEPGGDAIQATWQDGAVHLWGWNGRSTLSAPALIRTLRRAPWAHSGLVSNPLSSVSLKTSSGEPMRPMSIKLDPIAAADWLATVRPDDPAAPSVRWFAAAARLAITVVDAGHVLPSVRPGGDDRPLAEAWWSPLPAAELDDAIESLAAAMPPIAISQSGVGATDIVDGFVDGRCRNALAAHFWSPDVRLDRTPATAVIKATFAALIGADRRVPAEKPGHDDALRWVAQALERTRVRAGGDPVVTPRVRLLVPDDRFDPWVIRLELVDEAEPGRWCAAEDIWAANPLALDIAGDAEHLAVLERAVRRLAEIVGTGVEVLAPILDEAEPSSVELQVDDGGVDDFLEFAPDALDRLGVELIGPEHLVKSRVAVRGVASPAPPSDRSAGLDRDTIVQWSFTVAAGDGTEAISDAELARAEEAGSALLHTGHRWVRIDSDAIRRARKRLTSYVDDAEHAEAADGVLALLRLAAEADAAGDELSAPSSGGAVLGADTDADEARRYEAWSGRLLGGLPDDRLREERESAAFVGELRHYQRRGLSWLRFLARLGLGGCLADDMGLGKTATTLAHLVDRPGRHLVVCPLSVVHNWETEVTRFTPSLPVTVHHGAARQLGGTDQPELELAEPSDRHVTITTYGLLARDVEQLAAVRWATVVLDEAQFVKNPATKAARAVRRLHAEQRLALTGTPVENRLSELWSILDGVNPGMLGSREKFRHRYSKPIERADDEVRATEAAAELRRLTQPFILRRTKADRSLVPDLPDKIEQVAYAGLTREQAVLYQHVVDDLLGDAEMETGIKRRGLILAALTKLKQICNHPMNALGDTGRIEGRSGKLARFDELVDELVDVGERALVFTQYVDMGGILQRHLRARFAWSTPFLHGGVPRRQRTAMIDAFQAGSGPPLMLVSLKAGGTGLNLTAASQVIHYDRWWNPAVENQATDRAWRIGQQRTVLVHKLVCEGTVEERIDRLINDKQALADVVVGQGETWLSELTTSELRELVRLDIAAVPGRTQP